MTLLMVFQSFKCGMCDFFVNGMSQSSNTSEEFKIVYTLYV